jgi:hypothetical protein
MHTECLSETGVPAIIAASRPLAEAHRLDLALYVACEEASARIAAALVGHAPNAEAQASITEMASDDARHAECFGRRLDRSLATQRPDAATDTQALLLRVLQQGKGTTGALRRDEVVSAVVVPPLRCFLDRCRSVAEAGDFVEALALLALVFKGTTSPLSAFEARYWRPVDPDLADLIEQSDLDERRHLTRTARLVRTLTGEDAARRKIVATLCSEARPALAEALAYYARKLVALFATVARQHPERYADIEVVPGRSLATTSTDAQGELIRSAADAGYREALHHAGLDHHG